MLHGWSVDSRVWGSLRHRLQGTIETWAPDLPGHNGACIDLRGRGIGEFHDLAVEAFAAWCHDNRVDEQLMMGWAWGTQVLVDAIARRLVRPRSVALVSFAAPFQTPTTFAAVMRDWPRYARSLVRMMMVRPMSPETENWLYTMMSGTAIPAVAGVQQTRWEPPRHDLALPPDSIAILGGADRLNPPESARALLDRWGVATTVLDDVGHVPFEEDRVAFDEAVHGWIERTQVRC